MRIWKWFRPHGRNGEKTEKNNRALQIATTLSAAILVIGLCFLGRSCLDQLRLRAGMRQLRDMRDASAEVMEAENGGLQKSGDGPESDGSPVFSGPYEEFFLQNDDMVGWLLIPDTPIDYPVMQTMEDEEYYLRRDFYGNPNDNGSLFMDTGSDVDLPGTNLLVHGHNRLTEDMFGTLMRYEEEAYAKEHPFIFFTTREEERVYQVLGAFHSEVYRVTDQVFKYYQFFQADSEAEFDFFYDSVKALELYDTGVTAEYGDHFITLSTCSFIGERGRFVVVGRELREAELEKMKESCQD